MTPIALISADLAARLALKRYILALFAASLTANALLAATLLFRGETVTTVLLPTQVMASSSPATVKSPAFNEEYLALIARDFFTLAFNQTPENTDFNRKVLLSHAYPSSFGETELFLSDHSEKLKRLHASTLFAMESMQVDADQLTVTAHGVLMHYIGKKEASRTRSVAQLELASIAGRLYIKKLTLETDSH